MRLGAQASDQPCEMFGAHRPRVVRTQHHHSHPQYLQLRLWGEVRDGPDTWVCGNCHDAIHEVLSWLLGEARVPDPMPGPRIRKAAQASFDWFEAARTM